MYETGREGPTEVTHNMTDTPERDSIAAKLVVTLHRGNFYGSRAISVDGLVNRAPVRSDQLGDARQIVHEMASSEDAPVRYQVDGESVTLDDEEWDGQIVDFLRAMDASQIPWDMKE